MEMVVSPAFLSLRGISSSRRRLMDLRLEDEELEEQLLVRFLRLLVSINSQESWGIGLVAKSGKTKHSFFVKLTYTIVLKI